MDDLKILTAGDSSLFIRIGNNIDPETNRCVRGIFRLLEDSDLSWIIESVPSYTGIAVYLNPLLITHKAAAASINDLVKNSPPDLSCTDSKILVVPVCYDEQFGPDQNYVCEHNRLHREELISIHCNPDYLVYMLGFTPGFPYMGGMDHRIATPRKEKPRLKIPSGSVGIAGEQTGVYPIESPGGWQLIGRTPLKLFDPDIENPFLVEPGMHIRFSPVDYNQYLDISARINESRYIPEIIKTTVNERC